MKLTNEELNEILHTAGLELAQPYADNEKYRKSDYLFTRCRSCGTKAHYRLKYIIDKNNAKERVCRACYWMGWYGERRALVNAVIQQTLDEGYSIDELIEKDPILTCDSLTCQEAMELAENYGYKLINLMHGSLDGGDVLLARCKACGRQTVERPRDITFGCTCGGKAAGISFGEEAVVATREATPIASGLYQDGR